MRSTKNVEVVPIFLGAQERVKILREVHRTNMDGNKNGALAEHNSAWKSSKTSEGAPKINGATLVHW